MNSKERVFAVVMGKEPDVPPVSMTLSLYGSKLINVSTEIYYNDYKEYARGQSAVIDKIAPDILLAPFALAYEGAAFGSEITYLNNGVPNMRKPAFRSVGDFLKAKLPDINEEKHILYIRNSLKSLKLEYGNSFPIAAVVASPIDLPILFLGLDLWLETLLFNEPLAKIILEIIKEYFVNYANTLVDDGADIIIIPPELWNPRIGTSEIVTKYILPLFIETFPKIRAPIVLHNGGSPSSPIDLYMQMPNVLAFLLAKMDNFPAVRAKVGNDRLIMGNLEGPLLCNLSEKTIEKLCYNILENTKDNKNFIFATSSADIQNETEIEKLLLIKKIMSQKR